MLFASRTAAVRRFSSPSLTPRTCAKFSESCIRSSVKMAVSNFAPSSKRPSAAALPYSSAAAGRHKGFPIRLGQAAQKAGAGHRCARMRPCPAAVGRAQPRQRKAASGAVCWRQNCLAVFDAQNVVGGAQQSRRCRGAACRRPRPGRRRRSCRLQDFCVCTSFNFFTLQQPGRVQQRPRVGRLGPKSQCVTPEGGQQVHARGGELLRRGAGVGRGQGNDEIRPGSQRRAAPAPARAESARRRAAPRRCSCKQQCTGHLPPAPPQSGPRGRCGRGRIRR